MASTTQTAFSQSQLDLVHKWMEGGLDVQVAAFQRTGLSTSDAQDAIAQIKFCGLDANDYYTSPRNDMKRASLAILRAYQIITVDDAKHDVRETIEKLADSQTALSHQLLDLGREGVRMIRLLAKMQAALALQEAG